jgi:hypothetical protein
MKYRVGSAFLNVVVALVVFGSSAASYAQQTQVSPYQAMSDKFFDMLQQDKSSEALDLIFSTNPAVKKVPDKVDNLKSQFASLRKLAGPYVSHTKLVETKVAGMFVYQHFFVAYERQPFSVRITYYKPGATWLCQGLQFDVNIEDLIQKAADSKIPIEVN